MIARLMGLARRIWPATIVSERIGGSFRTMAWSAEGQAGWLFWGVILAHCVRAKNMAPSSGDFFGGE